MSKLPTMHEMIASYRPIGSGAPQIADLDVAATGSRVEAFVASMHHLRAGKARKVLQTSVRHNGEIGTRAALIESSVAAGRTVVNSKTGRRLIDENTGSFLSETAITKTGMDFAEWLTAQRGSL